MCAHRGGGRHRDTHTGNLLHWWCLCGHFVSLSAFGFDHRCLLCITCEPKVSPKVVSSDGDRDAEVQVSMDLFRSPL